MQAEVLEFRFLNMLASLEALMTLGKCRELPVVGFVRGYMVVGVIVRLYGGSPRNEY